MSGGIIGDYSCIGTNLNGFILNISQKEINPFMLLPKRFTLIKMIEQLILLAILNLKNYISMIFLRKQMNEEMEAELTEMGSRPDNLVVS